MSTAVLVSERTCQCGCGATFQPQAINQKYFSWSCSRRAERARRKARGRGSVNHQASEVTHITHTQNPSDDVLTIYVDRFIHDPKLQPTVFTGTFNREFMVPAGIVFEEDIESGGMIMGHEEAFK